MKVIGILAMATWAAVALGQTAPKDDSHDVEVVRLAHEYKLQPQPQVPGRVSVGSVTFSGTTVQLVRAPHPLQILNPAAPASYDSDEQSVVLDPLTHRPVGWKLFAINF